jgi:hypothetical protein
MKLKQLIFIMGIVFSQAYAQAPSNGTTCVADARHEQGLSPAESYQLCSLNDEEIKNCIIQVQLMSKKTHSGKIKGVSINKALESCMDAEKRAAIAAQFKKLQPSEE